jgi:hypothetical protein
LRPVVPTLASGKLADAATTYRFAHRSNFLTTRPPTDYSLRLSARGRSDVGEARPNRRDWTQLGLPELTSCPDRATARQVPLQARGPLIAPPQGARCAQAPKRRPARAPSIVLGKVGKNGRVISWPQELIRRTAAAMRVARSTDYIVMAKTALEAAIRSEAKWPCMRPGQWPPRRQCLRPRKPFRRSICRLRQGKAYGLDVYPEHLIVGAGARG